jgi:hypothetical protein
MLRELHEVLLEMHDSVTPLASTAQAGVRLSSLELTLPLDMLAVLRGGRCVLLADVARSQTDAHWQVPATRLHVGLHAIDASTAAGGDDV